MLAAGSIVHIGRCLKTSELVVGNTYWAKGLKLVAQDALFDFTRLAHHVPVLRPTRRSSSRNKVYVPYIYAGSEKVTVGASRRTYLLFIRHGKYVYVHSRLVSRFRDLSPASVRERVGAFYSSLTAQEGRVIDSLVDIEQPPAELLVMELTSGRRIFKRVPRTARGRCDTINMLLARMNDLKGYRYFTREGRLSRFIIKNVQIKVIKDA